MTGTLECFAKSATSECGPTRATMQEVMLEITTEVSYRVSLTPSWISSFPKNMAWPPIVATAASVETRVRVDRLLNIIATVLPLKLPNRFRGIEPDFMAVLCKEALRTRVVSSEGVRSAIERKWRGANGEVRGVAAVPWEAS
jgi:hypothetical protein